MLIREVTAALNQLAEIIAKLQFIVAELENAKKLELKKRSRPNSD